MKETIELTFDEVEKLRGLMVEALKNAYARGHFRWQQLTDEENEFIDKMVALSWRFHD